MTPLGPSRRDVVAVLLTLWQITRTATHDFVWNSVVEGTINVRPLSRPLRLLAVAGQLLIAGFLLSILFNQALRVNGPLELLQLDTGATRGLMAPSAAIPLTLVAMALGWGYVLAGALRVRPWLRWLIAAVYVGFGVLPLASATVSALAFGFVPWWSLLSLPLIAVALVVLPLLPPRPALEWCAMTALNGIFFCESVALMAYGEALSGGELRVSALVSSLALNGFALVAPFLFIAGLGWIDFALDLSSWTARAVRSHARGWLVAGLLLAFLAYRLLAEGRAFAEEATETRAWLALGGAAIFCGGLALIMAWRARRGRESPVPRRLVVGLLLVPLLLQIFIFLAINLAGIGQMALLFVPEAQARLAGLMGAGQRLSELAGQHRPLLTAALGVAVAVVAARRGIPSVAAFGMILAWAQVMAWLTASGRPLYALRYSYAEVDRLVLLALAGLAVYWLARRALSLERAVPLLALALLMALLNQTDFLDNPFSPLFGFAGVAFLVFGIVWNVLGAGGFANQDTPGLPRASRLMLYLGYVLISVSVAHWYLVSHNLVQQATQADFNSLGFELFGLPLAYLALVEGGRTLVVEEPEP